MHVHGRGWTFTPAVRVENFLCHGNVLRANRSNHYALLQLGKSYCTIICMLIEENGFVQQFLKNILFRNILPLSSLRSIGYSISDSAEVAICKKLIAINKTKMSRIQIHCKSLFEMCDYANDENLQKVDRHQSSSKTQNENIHLTKCALPLAM